MQRLKPPRLIRYPAHWTPRLMWLNLKRQTLQTPTQQRSPRSKEENSSPTTRCTLVLPYSRFTIFWLSVVLWVWPVTLCNIDIELLLPKSVVMSTLFSLILKYVGQHSTQPAFFIIDILWSLYLNWFYIGVLNLQGHSDMCFCRILFDIYSIVQKICVNCSKLYISSSSRMCPY